MSRTHNCSQPVAGGFDISPRLRKAAAGCSVQVMVALLACVAGIRALGDDTSSNPSCAPTPAGVVSWWRADENASDAAGNNNGVLVGNVTYGIGRKGKCFAFDGDRDGIMVGTGTNLHLQDFTIEAWIKRASTTVASYNGNGNATLFVVGTNPGGLGLMLQQADGCVMLTKSTGAWTNSLARIDDTNWHHVAVTKQETRVVLYVDGKPFRTGPFDPGPFVFSAPAYIGGWLNRAGQLDNSFNGAIDELAIFDRALKAEEIATLYAAAGAGKCSVTNQPPACSEPPSGLLSWWRAEDHAFDSMGANHGTLVGAADYGDGRSGRGFLLTPPGAGVRINLGASLTLQDFSIEAWVKRANSFGGAVETNRPACIFSLGSGNTGLGFYLRSDDALALGKLQADEVVSGARITNSNWHHVVVTKSGPTIIFYLDAVAYSTPRFDSAGVAIHSPSHIGARLNLFNQMEDNFNGIIDEVGLYGRPLSAVEVLSQFNAGSAGKCFKPTPPQIIVQPNGQTVTEGDDVVLTAAVIGSPPLSYQWRRYGINISTAISEKFSLVALQSVDAGTYSVVITNAFGSATSSNTLLEIHPRPDCAACPSGTVTWWRAESNAINELCATAPALLNNAGFAQGRVGTAFVFNGKNQLVQFSNTACLNPPTALSLECWVFAEQYPTNDCVTIASKEDTAKSIGHHQYGIGFVNYTGEWVVGTQVQLSGGRVALEGRTAISLRRWHHVAMTYDGSALKIYVDGQLDGFVAASGPIETSSDPFQIGGHSKGPWNLNGRVDELSLYHRALTPVEIKSIYDAGGAGKCPPRRLVTPLPSSLIGWWAAESNAIDSISGIAATVANEQKFAQGQVGTAFRFDAGSQLVQVIHAATLNPSNGLTVECWLNIEQFPTNHSTLLFAKQTASGTYPQYGFGLTNIDGTWTCQAIVGLASGPAQTVGTGGVSTSVWYHVAMTHDGERLRVYINGVANADSMARGHITPSSLPLLIGGDGVAASDIAGRLDEVALYDRALNADEIAANYLAGRAGKSFADPRPSTRDLRKWFFDQQQAKSTSPTVIESR